jgi:hypothetical protein
VERRRWGAFYKGGEGRRSARWWWRAIKRRLVTEEEVRGLTLSDEETKAWEMKSKKKVKRVEVLLGRQVITG